MVVAAGCEESGGAEEDAREAPGAAYEEWVHYGFQFRLGDLGGVG